MMSRNIDRLIAELVEDSMTDIKKMKKVDLQSLAKELLADNLRELTNDTIVRIYEERYKTNLSGV
jgi:septin family protein